MTSSLKMAKTRNKTPNGQRKKNLFKKTLDLMKEVYGRGNAFMVASARNPDSARARCQAPTDAISSATNAGVFPSAVSAKRSDPCSNNFCMQTGDPFTRAQCNAVKPCSSVTITLAPHRNKRSTQAEYPLYAAHIRGVWPCASGPSMGIFWWRRRTRRKTLPSIVAR